MTLDQEQYEGLGHLLIAAGVDSAKTQGMVASVLASAADKTREQIIDQINILMGDHIDQLAARREDFSLDSRRVLNTLRTDLDVYRRVWAYNHTIIKRIGILILISQLATIALLAGAVFAGLLPTYCELKGPVELPAEQRSQPDRTDPLPGQRSAAL